jgi:hypothetical protein
MATPKKNSYIEEELDWLERKAKQIKQYVDNPPISGLTDRIEKPITGVGVVEKVTATIEAQIKSKRESLKDYALILEAIDKLREREETKKVSAKGDSEIPYRMRNNSGD